MRNVSSRFILNINEAKSCIFLQQPILLSFSAIESEFRGPRHTNSTRLRQDFYRLSSNSSSTHRESRRRSYERKRNLNHDASEHRSQHNNIQTRIGSELNHYQRLNIQPGADIDTIKAAYYSLTKLYHPDASKTNDENSAENFRLITESYDILSNPETRAEYDRQIQVEPENVNLNELSKWDELRNYDPNILYKSKNAGIFFRTRTDALSEQERMKSPKKFRAGAFVSTDEDQSENRVSEKLEMMHRIAKIPYSPDEGLYTEHLRESARRRLTGWDNHPVNADSASTIWVPISTILCTLVFLGYSIASLFFDVDVADILDRRLEDTFSSSLDDQERDL